MSKRVTDCLAAGVVIMLIAFLTPTSAQRGDQDHARQTGSIKGRVLNAQGRPVSGAKVSPYLIGVIYCGHFLLKQTRTVNLRSSG